MHAIASRGGTLFAIILAMTSGLLIAPLADLFGGVPIVHIGDLRLMLATWSLPLLWVAAAVDLLIALHLAACHRPRARQAAKALLVSRA